MFRIIDGDIFSINNFPDKDKGKRKVPQFPVEKIETLNIKASDLKMQDCLIPINEIFNKDLRNSIFHSDYSIYKGCLRTKDPLKEFNRTETYDLINKSMAYFQTLKFLFEKSISDYKEPKDIIFPVGSNAKTGKVIVRKNFGVVGLCDNIDNIPTRALPFRIGKFKDYEVAILNKNNHLYLLPEDKSEKAGEFYNKFYKICPRILRNYFNKWNQKRINIIKNKLIKHSW